MSIWNKAALAAVSVFAFISTSAAQTVGFATFPPGSANYISVNVLAATVQEKTGLKLRVKPLRGGKAVQMDVNNGQSAFGIINADNLQSALEGIGEFEGTPLKNLRIAFRVRTLPLAFFVKEDSPIKTIADIKGKRFPSQWSAFSDAITLSQAIMATEGLTYEDIVGVPVTNIVRGADEFKAGRLDVGFFAVGAPQVSEIDAAVGGIRFLSIDKTPEKEAAMQKFRSGYFIHTVNPSPANKGINEPTNVLGVDSLIIVNADVDDETIAKVLEAVHSSKPELVKGHPSFNGFDPDLMAQHYAGMQYHAGAIAWYKAKGIWKGN
ncbi:TAXI family TRAP transporter solute-binding subunit [Pusillimonas sp.]|uniref:TAXI family TRAP transporter solute-binding subunit n=1 Tax=Pusillimonas sp. TaxID=3040095 RepID=UPI0029A5B95E|nr:TAXI family TRAP transporter solute-binding subunit [Pusillimonas sp.]MDX3894213.1 TAXI family TRAP transporter solute-binding subunit [Pusillimonas sp.]